MKPTKNQIITLIGVSAAALLTGYAIGNYTSKVSTSVLPESSEVKPDLKDESNTTPKPTDRQLPLSLISKTTDLVTDVSTHTLRISASTPGYNSIGIREDATVILRCEGNDLEVFVQTPQFLSSDSQTVQIRWGDTPAQQQRWTGASGGSALFSEAPRSFLAKAIAQDSFAIRYSPWQTVETSAKFEFKNYKNLLKEMKRVCS